MSVEANLPENVRRRVERQVRDSEHDVRVLRAALEFAEKARVEKGGPQALRCCEVEDVTHLQQRLLVKCLQADLAYALQLETSARRIHDETLGIDPDEDGAHEDPNDYARMGWVGKDGRP